MGTSSSTFRRKVTPRPRELGKTGRTGLRRSGASHAANQRWKHRAASLCRVTSRLCNLFGNAKFWEVGRWGGGSHFSGLHSAVRTCGNVPLTAMAKWKASPLPPGLAAALLVSLLAPAARLYLLRTGAGSSSAAAFTAQVRVGGPWLHARSPKFSFFFSRGPHLCPRTSSATWHLSLDGSGPFFVLRRTRLLATPHSACC